MATEQIPAELDAIAKQAGDDYDRTAEVFDFDAYRRACVVAVLPKVRAEALRDAAADCRKAIEHGSYGRLANEVADMVERTLLKIARKAEENHDG